MLINERSSHSELPEGFFLEDKNNKTKQTEPLKPNLFQSLSSLPAAPSQTQSAVPDSLSFHCSVDIY